MHPDEDGDCVHACGTIELMYPDGHPNSPGYGHFKIPHLRDRERVSKADAVGTCLAERKPDLPRWRSWSERFESKQANDHLYAAAAW